MGGFERGEDAGGDGVGMELFGFGEGSSGGVVLQE